MDRDKKLATHMQSKLYEYQQDRLRKSMEDGILGAKRALTRVRNHKVRTEQFSKSDIESLIMKQSSALQACNLERLLTS